MLEVTVNGEPRGLPVPPTVSALLTNLGLRPGSVVVELNGVALTRGEAAAVTLTAGDRIEVVRAVAGG